MERFKGIVSWIILLCSIIVVISTVEILLDGGRPTTPLQIISGIVAAAFVYHMFKTGEII